MVGEIVAVVLLLGLFVAMVVGVTSHHRRRDTCPKCGDTSKPDIPAQSTDDPKHDFSELVICKACGHQWRRMPQIKSAGQGKY